MRPGFASLKWGQIVAEKSSYVGDDDDDDDDDYDNNNNNHNHNEGFHRRIEGLVTCQRSGMSDAGDSLDGTRVDGYFPRSTKERTPVGCSRGCRQSPALLHETTV